MFCPKCGRKTQALGLCGRCFIRENPLKLRLSEIRVCDCGRHFYKSKWDENAPDVARIVSDAIDKSPEIEIEGVDVEPSEQEKKIVSKVVIRGSCRGEKFTEEMNYEIKKRRERCPLCCKMVSSYYEAVLQFRGDISPAIVRKAVDDKYLCKVEEIHGGCDAYLISSSYGKSVAKAFIDRGYSVKESFKLIGKKDGKDLYRKYFSIKPKEK